MDKILNPQAFNPESWTMLNGLSERLPWLRVKIADNEVSSYIVALLAFFAIWLVLLFLRFVVFHQLLRLAKTRENHFAIGVEGVVEEIRRWFLPALAFYFAFHHLEYAPRIAKLLNAVITIAISLQLVFVVSHIVCAIVDTLRLSSSSSDLAVRSARNNIKVVAKALVWVAGFLFALDNLGLNITTFVTGLGIGGIAVALAAQSLLGDAFSSFTIALDKPFEVGDFIEVDGLRGTVEHIGLKTTRVRSLNGELLVFGNSDLTTSRVHNWKRLHERRVCFSIGVVYSTPLPLMKRIPILLKQIVTETEKVRFDRAHFKSYGDFALIFEVAYFAITEDFNIHMDISQDIYFRIREVFDANGIEMAFPTQTIYVAGASSNALMPADNSRSAKFIASSDPIT